MVKCAWQKCAENKRVSDCRKLYGYGRVAHRRRNSGHLSGLRLSKVLCAGAGQGTRTLTAFGKLRMANYLANAKNDAMRAFGSGRMIRILAKRGGEWLPELDSNQRPFD